MKWLGLLCVASLLAACDDEVPSRPLPPAKPTVEAPAAAKPELSVIPVRAEVRDVERQPAKLEIDVNARPAAGGEEQKLPSPRTSTRPPKAVVAAATPAKKTVPVEKVRLPDPELDLSLPDDWAEELEPEQTAQNMDLLPPLFGSDEHSRSVQMSGSLLPGETEGEALIDGAQINFEIKR